MFFDQFSDFLEHSDSLPGKTLLMGDFNFHFENVENNNSRKLHDIIDSSISDYNNHLCSVLDKQAPLCRCTVRTRKPTPWFSSIAEQFCELKRERRQAER